MVNLTAKVGQGVKDYIFITFAYWGFTLTDGALRMLVVLYFHQLGYNALEVASLFLFYEFFGIVTNLFGGWLAARLGVKSTLFSGLFLQIIALCLLAQTQWLGFVYVMALQAISGVAKDLNKMSAKSAIKQLVPKQKNATLFKWIAFLTGSKNTLKGVGFFLGGALLSVYGYSSTLYILAIALIVVFVLCVSQISVELDNKAYKPKFSEIFSSSKSVNLLSFARFFLFASRDVWFVVALPVFLVVEQEFNSTQVGTLMAVWVIVYGIIQSATPKLLGFENNAPQGLTALKSAFALLLVLSSMLIAYAISISLLFIALLGLLLFAFVFAINSAIHSYLIVNYARDEGASMDVGIYYMANAAGRLLGTLLSGYLYLTYGFLSVIIASLCLVVGCLVLTVKLKQSDRLV